MYHELFIRSFLIMFNKWNKDIIKKDYIEEVYFYVLLLRKNETLQILERKKEAITWETHPNES